MGWLFVPNIEIILGITSFKWCHNPLIKQHLQRLRINWLNCFLQAVDYSCRCFWHHADRNSAARETETSVAIFFSFISFGNNAQPLSISLEFEEKNDLISLSLQSFSPMLCLWLSFVENDNIKLRAKRRPLTHFAFHFSIVQRTKIFRSTMRDITCIVLSAGFIILSISNDFLELS